MLKVFLFSAVCIFLCLKLFEFRSIVRFVKLSYESELTETGLRWSGTYMNVVTCTFTLSSSRRLFDRLFLTKHCRCFGRGTKGADGAADLLEALSQSPLLEELLFRGCSQIPAAAWQKVRSAKWLHLKTANCPSVPRRENWLKIFLFLRVFICLC